MVNFGGQMNQRNKKISSRNKNINLMFLYVKCIFKMYKKYCPFKHPRVTRILDSSNIRNNLFFQKKRKIGFWI
jgi:hypothetical protein